jgi:hypothetical protein
MTASIVKLRKGPSGPVADPDEISDHKVKVSALDAAAGFLDSKLAAGAGITLTTVDLGGGFLAVQIAATGGGASGVPLAAAYFDGAGALASVAQYLADKPDAVEFNSAALVFRTPPLTAVPHTIEIQAYSNEPSGQVSVPIPAGNSNLLVSEVAA